MSNGYLNITSGISVEILLFGSNFFSGTPEERKIAGAA